MQKILASEPFAESERLRQFLRFTVDLTLQGGGMRIKEYLLGVEVFGKEESFDPRTDAIVRVQAGKLRSKLEKYYASEGCEDPVVIEYPKGSYVPTFKFREAAAPVPRSGPAPWRGTAALAAAGLAVAGLAVYWAVRNAHTRQPSGGRASIAVLPFVDMSAGRDQEYLCDGITEEIITALSKLEGLHVVARTSTFEFKGKGQDIRKIGAQLNVGTVLEGSVRKAGASLRVVAQLINVADGYHIWSETYDRETRDVFTIQESIAQAIVGSLRVRLTPREKARLAKRYTDNLDAYNLYLQGRYHTATQGPEGAKVAIQYFEQALALEPRYAPALAGLAVAYQTLNRVDGMPPAEAISKGRDAAKKALEIDEGLGAAHAALAVISGHDLDYSSARKEFQRAIELDPNDAATRQAYAFYLARTGRTDESRPQMRRCLELDPLSPSRSTAMARICIEWHEFDNAAAQCRKVLERDPRNSSAYSIMGSAFSAQKRFPEAVAAYEKACALSGRAPGSLGGLGYTLGMMGEKSAAEKILRELEEKSKQRYVSPIYFAMVHMGLGQKDQAIEWLERTYQVRSHWLMTIPVDYQFDALHSEPRFQALLKKMNLPLPEPLTQP
ncbi:MAG: tetratricopeptide repeat protein [Candidatus Solibacter usitatus]|nr:tetratricopeptide repeat protein [Candidatus Solibacter usitatus]